MRMSTVKPAQIRILWFEMEELRRSYPKGNIAADVVINAFKQNVVTLDVNNVSGFGVLLARNTFLEMTNYKNLA